MTTRGIRNNNPGNIEKGKDAWQGLAKEQPDARFCTFTDPVFGIRAICRILLNYKRAGVNSVARIIARWAPPGENKTDAYVSAVAAGVGVSANEIIDIDSAQVMLPLVKAIITHENGSNPYPDSVIRDAMRLAGVADAPQKSLVKKVANKAVAGTCVALAGAAQYAEPIKHAADALAPAAGSAVIQKIVTVLLTVAGVCILAGVINAAIKHKRGLA